MRFKDDSLLYFFNHWLDYNFELQQIGNLSQLVLGDIPDMEYGFCFMISFILRDHIQSFEEVLYSFVEAETKVQRVFCFWFQFFGQTS